MKFNLKNLITVMMGMTLIWTCSPKTSVATQNVNKPNVTDTKATSNEFASAKIMYETTCIKCHALKDASRYTAEELQKIVPKMVIKANKKAVATVVNSEQEAQLIMYLTSICKK